MKTITTCILLFLAGVTASYAQCGTTFKITSSKTEHLDTDGKLVRTEDEKATVVISKTDINITVNNGSDEHKMSGAIKSNTCNWPVAYKEGKTVLKAVIAGGDNGAERNVTITIIGKDGKVTLSFDAEGEDDRIRITADKFEGA